MKLVPVHELALGQEVLLKPRSGGVMVSGAELPAEGSEVRLTEYHFGLVQRGAALAFVEEPAPAPAPAPPAAEGPAAPEPPAEEPAAPQPAVSTADTAPPAPAPADAAEPTAPGGT